MGKHRKNLAIELLFNCVFRFFDPYIFTHSDI